MEPASKEISQEEVRKKLQEAETLKQTNLKDAIQKLEDAKNLLLRLKLNETGRPTDENKTDTTSQDTIYLQKRAHICYELQDYAEAYSALLEIKEKVGNNPQINKECGDCLRKQKKYDEALKEYDEGLEIFELGDCAVPAEKAKFQNSKGLVLVELERYEDAINEFSEAINNADGENPLYYSNRGNANYAFGRKHDSISDFKKARELLNAPKLEDKTGLTSGNLKYITTTLDKFIPALEELDKIHLNQPNKHMELCEINFVQTTTKSMIGDSAPGDNARSAEQTLTTKLTLKDIEGTPYAEYYDGFVWKISTSYTSAGQILNSPFELKIEIDQKIKGLAFFVSFIPKIGSIFSKGITKAAEFCKKEEIEAGAAYMSSCATVGTEIDVMAFNVIMEVIREKRQQIIEMEKSMFAVPAPDQKSFIERVFQFFRRFQDDIESHFYGGKRNTKNFQKLGCQHATLLISHSIATGKCFEGFKDPFDARSKLEGILTEAMKKLIDEMTEQKVNANNPISPEVSKQPEDTKKKDNCTMF